MHVLEAGKRIELLDPCLHVMPGDLLPFGDACKINVLNYALGVFDHQGRFVTTEVHAKVMLGPQNREPQPQFRDDLAIRRPDLAHRPRRIAVGQDVADPHCSAHRQPRGGGSDVVTIERPSSWISEIESYARPRAASMSSPSPTTASTRPPVGLIRFPC